MQAIRQGHTRRGRRAIFLISVLFFSLLVTMFVGAAVALVPSGLGRTQVDAALGSADRAAKSGIDWARSRISANPAWNASGTLVTFNAPGLYVTEGQGQVVGWMQQTNGWSRFRIRFNYQDGPISTASNSDNMADPTPSSLMWSDFPYVSCNNLLGAGSKQAPIASGSTYSNPSPWPSSQTQLIVPSSTLLLSVEGSSGNGVAMQGSYPSGFTGSVHTKTVQTVLKFGNNQPITSAAIMSAGELETATFPSSPISLSSTTGVTARLRTKGVLDLTTGVTSSNGDLRYGPSSSPTTGPLSPGITVEADGAQDGFYQIAASSVRTPQSPVVLPAGVYVMGPPATAGGNPTVSYVPMTYAQYVAATPAPTGTPISFPSGMTATPNPSGTPPYQITVTSDMTVSPTPVGGVTLNDFALVPNGGAAQSATYGGVTPSPTTSATPDETAIYTASGLPTSGSNFASNTVNTVQINAWLGVVNGLGQGSFPVAGFTDYWLTSDHGPLGPYIGIPTGGTGTLYLSNGLNLNQNVGSAAVAAAIQGASPATIAALNAAYGVSDSGAPSGSPTSSASPTATATPLLPKDIELNMQSGGASGLMMANSNGSITIGTQIQGNGAAISSSSDIRLIGTSTDLNSSPGTALGLNLYAQGNITVDAYKLDSTGASYHGINLKGVIYSWNGINILAGNSTSSGPFALTGTMVAYGGNPTGSPTPGSATTTINASTTSIVFDPSYVVNLVNTGPFNLEVLSWHEL